MKKLDIPDYKILYDLYIDEEMSLAKVGAELGVTTMTVRAWLNKLNIPVRPSNVNINKELRYTEPSDYQYSVLLGSLLGDGFLRRPPKSINAYFGERHAISQLEYLSWKREVLKPFSCKFTFSKGGDHIISGTKCKVQDSVKFITCSNTYLTGLCEKWYEGNGNKVLPRDLEKEFNMLSFAVWICDDGSLNWNKKYRNYKLDLHTESFSYEDQLYLTQLIKMFFNGTVNIYPRKYKSGKKYYISLSNKLEVHNLCSNLKDYIPECMWYKFNTNV